jgi:DNA (cytosine-5)-methyltransferase 1
MNFKNILIIYIYYNYKIMTTKIIDLFCGNGAFSHCFEKHNKYKCVMSNDIEKSSQLIYKLNFKEHNFILQDLNKIDIKNIPKHDILCGGFPCQPFSIAGKRKGFEDKRSNVFWKIIEILKHFKTEIVLLENVKNLKTHDKGNTFKTEIRLLR